VSAPRPTDDAAREVQDRVIARRIVEAFARIRDGETPATLRRRTARGYRRLAMWLWWLSVVVWVVGRAADFDARPVMVGVLLNGLYCLGLAIYTLLGGDE
jgi:hypothetical protein